MVTCRVKFCCTSSEGQSTSQEKRFQLISSTKEQYKYSMGLIVLITASWKSSDNKESPTFRPHLAVYGGHFTGMYYKPL